MKHLLMTLVIVNNMIVYIDSANFSTATTVYLDSLLTEVAPDGYYSDNINYRRQLEGKLTDIVSCPGVSPSTYHFSNPGRNSSSLACAFTTFTNTFYSDSIALDLDSVLYTNSSLTTRVAGGDQWFQDGAEGTAYQINNSGVIIDFYNCI